VPLSRIRDDKRILLGASIALALLAEAASAQPVPAARTWNFGVLFWHDSPNDFAALEGIRTALWRSGRPHELLVETAHEDERRAAEILARWREQPVDLVFAMGTRAALLAAEHVRDLPVVFTAVTNPVESGVVRAWEGSGRNLAGNSNWIPPETLLHVFRLAVPGLARIGFLHSPGVVVSAAELRAMRAHVADREAGALEIVEAPVQSVEELPAAVQSLVDAGVQAIWIPIDHPVYEHTEKVLELVRPRRIPLVSSSWRGTQAGAVAGVVVDYPLLGQGAVALALRILEQGADPGALPVRTMSGFRVVVNLAAARRCDYELPLSLLVIASDLSEELEGRAPGTEGESK
jgi:putative ABC transport system substrate-binding protein